MNTRLARAALALILPVSLAGLGVVPYLQARDSLPDRVATHFDGNLMADDSMSAGMSFAIDFAMIAIGIALMIGAALAPARLGQGTPIVAGVGGLLAGLGASIASSAAWTQDGLARWQDATLHWGWVGWLAGLGIGAALVAARAGAALMPEPDTDRDLPDPEPALSLLPNQRSVWAGSASAQGLLVLGVVFVGMAVVLALLLPWPIGLILVLTALPVLALSRVVVRVDEEGLSVRYGFLGWPSTQIPIADITQASVITVRPTEWGGWGYRGSLKLMNQAAVVVRAGPGIRLDLHDGKVFVVTVNRPENGAALLNGLVQRDTLVDNGVRGGV